MLASYDAPAKMRTQAQCENTRVLADDVLLMAHGSNMLAQSVRELNATHVYLHAMGVKVASAKSYNFANVKSAKEWLENTKWEASKRRWM